MGREYTDDDIIADAGIWHSLAKFTIRSFPYIGYVYKPGVPIFSDEFISTFITKSVDYTTIEVIVTIGTGFKLSIPETAYFNLTFRFINIPFPILISQFTATTNAPGSRCTTSLTISATASDFSYRHSTRHFIFYLSPPRGSTPPSDSAYCGRFEAGVDVPTNGKF